MKVAAVPLNLTAVAPVKFVPLMVTLVPTSPLVGVTLVIAGGLERRFTRSPIIASARSPRDARIRRIRKLVGDHAARDRAHDQLEVRIGIDVGEGRGTESAVPAGTNGRSRKIDPVKFDAVIVEDVELPDAAGRCLRPRREDDLRVAVVVQVDDDGLASEAELVPRGAGHRYRVRPVAVLPLVEPIGVNLAVVGGKEDSLNPSPSRSATTALGWTLAMTL